MSYVHLFLSNKWCNLLNITVLVAMHRIFTYNKDNKHLSYKNLLMTRSHSSCIITIHSSLYFNELWTNLLIIINNLLFNLSRKIFTLQEPQPCSPFW